MKKILMDARAIKELLEKFKSAGYDRIHISGGTSKDGAHYSGIIVYQYDASLKRFAFVGLPYDSDFYKRDENVGKNPNHTKRDGETPKETAQRELFEETGLKVDNLDDLIEVYTIERPDNRPERKGHIHTKHYYMLNMEKCSGELHTFEGANPIDAETMAPELFIKDQFEKILFGAYEWPLKKAIEKLKGVSADYWKAL